MSKNNNYSVKKEQRDNTLTLEQYNIFVAFLKHCIKPNRKILKNAGLAGNLNADQGSAKGSKEAYARFTSIAKRLLYRESDNELIFKSNSKIVLPRTRFEEVILRAHKSQGNKHLNFTKTIQKLGENYTIGYRQFGITEENVRVVVRMCQDGSCAKKNTTEMGVLKHFANSEKESSSKSNTSTASEANHSLGNQCGQTPVPLVNNIPLTVVQLPNGGFGFKSSAYVPGFTSLQQLPMVGTNACLSSNQCSTLYPSTASAFVANFPNIMHMNLPISMTNEAAEKKDFTCVQVPIKIITGGAQPLMAGQQIHLVTTGAYWGNYLNIDQGTDLPIDLSKHSRENDLPIDLSKHSKENESQAPSTTITRNEDLSPQKAAFINTPCRLDLNNNEITSTGANQVGKCNKSETSGSTQLTSSGSVTNRNVNDGDLCCSRDCQDAIDLTGSCEGKKHEATVQTTKHTKTYSSALGPLPHPNIWYNYKELSRQTNPYKRISMCIKDMRTDVMRSVSGSYQATELMRKKMHYIQELITTQQSVTQYMAGISSDMDMK